MRDVPVLARATLGLCVLLLAVSSASAQETTVELKSGVVLGVDGNELVVLTAGGVVKEVTVPEGFQFNMDGRMLTVDELEPGMRITAMITTTKTPIERYGTEVRRGEVVHVAGNNVVVRTENGKYKKFNIRDVKGNNATLYRKGKEVDLQQLRKGDEISATVVTKLPPTTMTTTQYEAFVRSAPTPTAQARPAPAPAPRREPEPTPVMLPKTGSPVPLAGLIGLISLAAGAGLTILRRFRVTE